MAAGPGRPARLRAVDELLAPRRVAAGLALTAGLLAAVVSLEVFPYRSINHDEGVYLQQAAMLLDGRLVLDPPVEGAFRPWFFVADGDALYPKYAPVPAAVYAVGLLLGDAHLALVAVAAATVALTYAVVAEAFDARTGVVAAALLVATPLFVVQSAVFLPYVPTLALLLGFAWAYLRADRTGSRRWAAVAGAAVGLAFFARPYTAVLFALPFVGHALWRTAADGRDALERQAVTAALGLAGVAVALGYNALLTGSALTFPYRAFGPLDGPGFGRRALLGYEVVYDLELALASARVALTEYALRWSVAAPVGVVLAAVGLGSVLRRGRAPDSRKLAVAGLAATVPLGQLYFWGTFNAIGDLDSPGLGLLGHLGPFYHLALVVPTAAFAAVALVRTWDSLRPRVAALDTRRSTGVAVALAVLVAGLGGAATVAAVADPIDQNRVVTDAYETAYEPLDGRSLENALVFLPTPYGPWLNHPFQYLRNDPGFDGPVVYALDREVFAVVDAYPDRALYRYAYRGEWYPADGDPVAPALRRLSHVSGRTVRLDAVAGLPPGAESASVALRTEAGDRVLLPAEPVDGEVGLTATVDGDRARLHGPSLDGSETVPVDAGGTLSLSVLVDTGGLDSFEYALSLPVRREGGAVRAITPRQAVCSDVRRCADGAAYVPGEHPEGVWLETELSASDAPRTTASARGYLSRSWTPTRRMDPAMAAPPRSGSSVVSPARSRYSMGTSITS